MSRTLRLRLIETEQRTLVEQLSAPNLAPRVQLLERQMADQARQLADLRRQALERPRQPRSLRQGNDDRKVKARRLDTAIERLLAGHPRAAELTARQIREALAHEGFSPLPSERTVRLHLANVRGNGNADGVAG